MQLFEERLGSAISSYGVSARQSSNTNEQAHGSLQHASSK